MLEAGVGRFSRAPALAAELLAVALAALATLPSLLRRLQVIVLRLRSRGKEVIQSHIGTYYSSCDEDDDEEEEEEESSDEADTTSSSGEEEQDLKRIGFYEGAAVDGGFPWGGAVVRTWQGLPRAFSGAGGGSARPAPLGGVPAVRLWGAMTASGGEPWWAGADERRAAAEASSAPSDQVVVGWRREHAASRRRRRAPLPHVRTN
ncbi:uncharacterized protein C2845_PM04G15840 [Panicum miliaceum]|uniref:Uncharacterized protein n=1 Tax=Panicum miliaceum TaxID=4540 RepID=A0A3L6QRI7_PANMI|nr:uncharacterized protein C2845_PM04G15840 [Panicum miliaceum]